jgi:hypothetical protein
MILIHQCVLDAPMVMRVGSKSHERPLCYAASRSWKQSKPCDLILSSEGFTSMWSMACSRASFGAITLLNFSPILTCGSRRRDELQNVTVGSFGMVNEPCAAP